ncbi:hypothetical protein [Pelagibacterium halotolerans]|uniref:hypothetical protein n=1 Tax=Pelagibacterium halotolerans TaxID=531813 RepID=UPI00384C6DF0
MFDIFALREENLAKCKALYNPVGRAIDPRKCTPLSLMALQMPGEFIEISNAINDKFAPPKYGEALTQRY